MDNQKYYYGWTPDPHRENCNDLIIDHYKTSSLPKEYEIEDLPEVFNQGKISSCTANAICSILQKKSSEI